jgi:copper chaperone CopZ
MCCDDLVVRPCGADGTHLFSSDSGREGAMRERTVLAPDISCGHCAMTIKREIGRLPGVASVEVNVEARQVTVHWDESTPWADIADKLTEIGYPPSL